MISSPGRRAGAPPSTGARGLDDRRPALGEVVFLRPAGVRRNFTSAKARAYSASGTCVRWRSRGSAPGSGCAAGPRSAAAASAAARAAPSPGARPRPRRPVQERPRGGPEVPSAWRAVARGAGRALVHGAEHLVVRGAEPPHASREHVGHPPRDPAPGIALDAVGEPVEGVRTARGQPAQRQELRKGEVAAGTTACRAAGRQKQGAHRRSAR